MQDQKKNESIRLKDAKPEDVSDLRSRLQKQQAERKAEAEIREVIHMVQNRDQYDRL